MALTTVVVVAGEIWLRPRGGLDLGDEPGRTLHAHYTLPELIQPVLLAALAVAVGAAVVHVIRQRLVASIVLVVGWFLFGATYWLFGGPVVRWLAPIQPQPMLVEVGPSDADPSTFPTSWLLTAPGEYQDYWARVVVSPAVAAWHDVYLVGVIAVLVGIAVPGRLRRPLLVGGVAGRGHGRRAAVGGGTVKRWAWLAVACWRWPAARSPYDDDGESAASLGELGAPSDERPGRDADRLRHRPRR